MDSSQQFVKLLSTRFLTLKPLCDEIIEQISSPTKSSVALTINLSSLKNELRLIDVAINSDKIRPIIRRFSITSEELYILSFSSCHRFQSKAFKGNDSSIIECVSAIRASISLWETRVFPEIQPEPKIPSPNTSTSVTLKYNSSIKDFEWDVFISHASEDKATFVEELASRLEQLGLRVWYDDFTLTVGDHLRESIEMGLANSKYGIVVLSQAFFRKNWPQKELSVLLMRDSRNNKVILPIWLDLGAEEIYNYFPLLADVFACKAIDGMDNVVGELMTVINPSNKP